MKQVINYFNDKALKVAAVTNLLSPRKTNAETPDIKSLFTKNAS